MRAASRTSPAQPPLRRLFLSPRGRYTSVAHDAPNRATTNASSALKDVNYGKKLQHDVKRDASPDKVSKADQLSYTKKKALGRPDYDGLVEFAKKGDTKAVDHLLISTVRPLAPDVNEETATHEQGRTEWEQKTKGDIIEDHLGTSTAMPKSSRVLHNQPDGKMSKTGKPQH